MGAGMTAGGVPANKMLHRGDQVDYTRAADVAPGSMVQVGAALAGLDSQGGANGTDGALAIEGVIDCADPDSAGVVGSKAGFDFANQKVTAAAGGDLDIGICVAVDTTNLRAWIKLVPGIA